MEKILQVAGQILNLRQEVGIALKFTNKQKFDRNSIESRFFLILIWIVIIAINFSKKMYVTAVCFGYATAAFTAQNLVQHKNSRSYLWMKWIFLLVGFCLLLLLVQAQDWYPYSQWICAVIILVGCFYALKIKPVISTNPDEK